MVAVGLNPVGTVDLSGSVVVSIERVREVDVTDGCQTKNRV